MRNAILVAFLGLGLAAMTGALAGESRAVSERQIRRVLRQAFPDTRPDWQRRLEPDATMTLCAQWRNQPPKEVADAIRARETLTITYPEDDEFLGDWRRGEAIAQSGYGLRFTDTEGSRANGGNCYACHELSPDEVSFGTIGVSLKGYGRTKPQGTEAARTVYEKIFNSQALVACSLMPRFGANGILSVDQIKDLVALLLDPESPVNRAPDAAPTDAGKGR